MNLEITWSGIKNDGLEGEQAAEELLSHLHNGHTVELNLAEVSRMTSSFANCFVMTILAKYTREQLRERCTFKDVEPNVREAITRAIDRYESGIRLSGQRAANPAA